MNGKKLINQTAKEEMHKSSLKASPQDLKATLLLPVLRRLFDAFIHGHIHCDAAFVIRIVSIGNQHIFAGDT